jgi:hypothetical protein
MPISSEDFSNIREELSGQDPLIKRIKLSDIQLDDNSIEHGCIHIAGHRVPVSRSFFSRLGQIVSLNLGLMNRMAKHEDKTIQIKLLEAVKAYAESRDGTKEFLLIGDQEQHQITNIVNADRYNRLTNETLFDTAEMLLNEVPDLSIDTVDRIGNGNMSINLIHANEQGFSGLGPDEIFRFGVSLVNGPQGSRIDDYVLRLSCENGMLSRTPTGSGPTFGGGGGGNAGPEQFRDIINQAHIWSTNGFIPLSFQDRLERASKTMASYGEMNRAFTMVEQQIQEEDSDRKLWIAKAAKAQLFPSLEEADRRILAKGFNPRELNDEQKKFIKTNRSVWDLINDMTWIGSHNTLYNLSHPKKFKVEGGRLFVKSAWDLEHAALASV